MEERWLREEVERVKREIERVKELLKKEKRNPFLDLLLEGLEERLEGLERELRGEPVGKLPRWAKEEIDRLTDYEKAVLLAMAMESVRGYWGYPVWERIGVIAYLCDTIKSILPRELLRAIKHNAYLFTGGYIDGRIFRDGDRFFGLSGYLSSYITGDDRVEHESGFYGTYKEVWELVKKHKEPSRELMLRLWKEILEPLGDETWADRLKGEVE